MNEKTKISNFDIKNEVYKLSPLKEAAVEIRFPANPAVECRRDIFFDHVKSEFPDISLPNPPIAIPKYRFQSADGMRTIVSAINMLAYSTQSYEKFSEFRDNVADVVKFFAGTFKVCQLNRFGIRYINIFPAIRRDGNIAVEDILNLKIELPAASGTGFSNFALKTENKLGKWTMISGVEAFKENEQDNLRLDIDCFLSEKLDSAHFSEYMDDGHAVVKSFFEDMVTDGYKNIMRGEVLK